MTTITVPAAEVQPGDTFSIAGNTVTVTDVRPHPLLSTLVKLSKDRHRVRAEAALAVAKRLGAL